MSKLTGQSNRNLQNGGEPGWNHVPVMLAAVDAAGRAVAWNAAARAELGQPPPSPGDPEQSWSWLVPCEEDRRRLLQQLASGAALDGWELPSETQQGPALLTITAHAAQTDQQTPRIVALTAASGPEPRVRHLERMLQLSRQDRQLIAYEIHDGIVQEMTGALMFLEAAQDNKRKKDDPCCKNLADAARLLRQCIEDARRLINGLQPPELDHGGLIGAVESLIEMHRGHTPQVELRAGPDIEPLDETIQLAVFRIIQESLTNIRRHSQSDRAVVELRREGEQIRLCVRDWGVGFDVRQTATDQRHGLTSIRQRAQLLGGTVDIVSQPGQGTIVNVRLPAVGPA